MRTPKVYTVQGLTERRRGFCVLCHGCFDVLHLGHIRHLKAAKRFLQEKVKEWAKYRVDLIVTVTPDRFVYKGDGRPIFADFERAEAVAALACVDFVAVSEWPSAVPVILKLKPLLYIKGGEYDGKMTNALAQEKAAVESVGGKLVFTTCPPLLHTTDLLEKLRG